MRLRGFSVVILLFLHMNPAVGEYFQSSNKLHKVLYGNESDYNRFVRPSGHINITFLMMPKSLTNMNIEAQTMTLKYILSLNWIDSRMTWKPEEYDNITYSEVDAGKLWVPPLYVENKVSAEGFIRNNMVAIAYYHGRVYWQTELSTETECAVTTKHYPFDQQRCSIEFAIWGDMKTYGFAFDGQPLLNHWLVRNAEWDVVNTTSEIVVREWKEGNANIPRIIFTLTVSRKKAYYVTAIIVPVLLLSVLIVAVFWVPVESGEKIGYCLTILLTYTLFLSIVSEELPPIASEVSYLQLYLAVAMGMSVKATIATVLGLYLYYQGDVAAPCWLSKLASCCCKTAKAKHRVKGTIASVAIVTSDETNGSSDKDEEDTMTYQEVAMAVDRFCLYLNSILMFLLTASFLGILLTPSNAFPSQFVPA